MGEGFLLEEEVNMLWFFLILSITLNAFLFFVAHRFAMRAKQLDDMMFALSGDIQSNIDFFDQVLATPMLTNSPEIRAMRQSQVIIRDQYVNYLEEFFKMRGEKQEETETN